MELEILDNYFQEQFLAKIKAGIMELIINQSKCDEPEVILNRDLDDYGYSDYDQERTDILNSFAF